MTIYFSKSKGFLDSSLHVVIPKDATEISEKLHRQLLAAQSAGCAISADADGIPYAAEAPALSDDTKKMWCKRKANELLEQTDWSQIHDARNACLNAAEFDAYRAQLRELRTNPVADPVWPTQPKPSWSFVATKGE